ncbi:MAG: DUF2059 domain-containing protein [Hyphomicrobiales bacterium]|nr:DUF2059 domain-containing protein [Hyphomicrobiales bacterium]
MSFMRHFGLATLFLACALQTAQSAGDVSVEDLIKKSGGVASIAELPQAMRSGLEAVKAQGLPVDETFTSAWNDAADEAFQPAKVLPRIAETLNGVFTQAEHDEVAAFYDTPLGVRIVQFEKDGSSFQKQAEVTAYAQSLTSDPGKYASRMALYHQLDEAAGLTKISISLAMNMGVAIQAGMVASGKLPMELSFDDIKREAEKQRLAISQQMAGALYASMAYIYKDLSQEDMLVYINFAKSPAGAKFMAAYFAAVDLALTDASRDFGKRLAENFGRKPI